MTPAEKMELAINLGRAAIAAGEVPTAAVLFRGDQVISQSHAYEVAEKRYLSHAEIGALMKADSATYSIQDRKEMELYCTLEPCIMCFGACMSFFLGSVFFALHAPNDGALRLLRTEQFSNGLVKFQQPSYAGGIQKESARQLFEEYLKTIDSGGMFDFALSVVNANR